MKFKYFGKTTLVLNPFFGNQLVPFTSPGRALIVFEGRSKTSWADLRTKLCGATDPSAAVPGSIRNELLLNRDATGMTSVDKGSNGVHMSAGPLEGLVELQRFFTDHEEGGHLKFIDLSFGAKLVEEGLTEEQVIHLASNPDVQHDGENISVFDLTEEKDGSESAVVLKKVLSQ